MIQTMPLVFAEAKRLFNEFDDDLLLLAAELEDQSFSLWRPKDTFHMSRFFVRPTRVALCFIRHAMIVDPNVIDLLPEIENKWRDYMTNLIYPPLLTPLTECIRLPEGAPAHPERKS